jgi:biopolymer transport protein TolQ
LNPSDQFSILDFISSSGPIAQAVLATLVFCSIASWAIIFYKTIALRKAELANRRFLAVFLQSKTLEELKNNTTSFYNDGPVGALFGDLIEKAGHDFELKKIGTDTEKVGLSIGRVERILRSGQQDEIDYYEKHLHFLATIGNTTPFIGLFGTVVGIISAFRAIGMQEAANIAVVAPGISEALIATAAGLAAAIPAVVAYNIFTTHLRRLEVKLEIFSSELINFIEETRSK